MVLVNWLSWIRYHKKKTTGLWHLRLIQQQMLFNVENLSQSSGNSSIYIQDSLHTGFTARKVPSPLIVYQILRYASMYYPYTSKVLYVKHWMMFFMQNSIVKLFFVLFMFLLHYKAHPFKIHHALESFDWPPVHLERSHNGSDGDDRHQEDADCQDVSRHHEQVQLIVCCGKGIMENTNVM